MDSVFVAQTFDPKDRLLVSEIDRILYSHGIQGVTGHHLGGDALDDAVRQRIDSCDCLVALATRRDPKADNSWTTHPWVINEYDYAKANDKEAIALVEEGVEWQGMYQAHEYIPLDRERLSDALLKLSNNIGIWKERAGETWKLQVFPEELAERIELEGAGYECTYRTVQQGNYSDWHPVTPVPEPGGVFLYVKGVTTQQKIEVKLSRNREVWKSPATPKWMPVKLKELR